MLLRIHRKTYIRTLDIPLHINNCLMDHTKESEDVLECLSDGVWVPVPIHEDVFDLRRKSNDKE